jgi:glycosyltransferase involved in cell wall biosynthesis
LSDDDLALAYGGALALVYPSLYEGFGMPVIEAMASGCPVITTNHGSLAEAAGDAALLIGGTSAEEMQAALESAQDAGVRARLRQRGFDHVRRFQWKDMASQLAEDLSNLVAEARAGHYDEFLAEWKRLREMQANVDFTQ